jgi:YD repeat-containing protein
VTESVNGDSTVAYTYDRDDLLTGAGDLVITRDAATGFPVSTALGGITHTQSHSGFGQVTNYTLHAAGNLLYGASFTRDAIGRLAQRIETVGGITTSFDYTYDLLGQLTAVAKDGVPIESYAYDANGNRTNTTAGGVNRGSTHDDQDRLLTHGSTSYDYTPAGRLRTRTGSGGTTEYGYDAIGNLLSVTLPGGTSITYLLDGVDRRVGRQVNGVTVERYIYSGDQLVAQLDSNGAIVSRFVYSGGFLPAYLVRGGVKFRIFEDHVGSVRLVVNATSGAIVQQMDYDSFGNVIMDTNPGFQPFGLSLIHI